MTTIRGTRAQRPTQPQPSTQIGAFVREGLVTALAGALKVGAEFGRVAARATSDMLDVAGRVTTATGPTRAETVLPEVPTSRKPRSAKTGPKSKAERKPSVRSGKKLPGRRRKAG
jgi:hypothetical protein